MHISASDRGAPTGRHRGEERAGHSQLQGDGGPRAQRGMAEGRAAGENCQGRPQVPQVSQPPHCPLEISERERVEI